MKHRRIFARSLQTASFLVGAALTASCDTRSLISPSAEIPGAPRPWVSSPVTLATAALPAPDDSWHGLVTPPESTWVMIQASGRIDAERNPACGSQPPNWPCIFNPPAASFEPQPNTLGPVQIAASNGERWSSVLLRGTGGAANTGGEAVGLYFHEIPGNSLSARLSLLNPLAQSPNPGQNTPAWILTGSYALTVVAIPSPLTLSGGPTGDTSGTVRYSLGTVAPLQITRGATLNWWFVPGDSVPANSAVDGTSWYLQDCRNRMECTWTPPAGMNGRVQATTYVEGQYAVVRSDYVRPRECGSVPHVAASAVAASNCGSGQAQQARLVLSCPASVTRGGEISCGATVDPVAMKDSLQVTGWSFDWRPRTDGDVHSLTWAGPMVDSGMVRVRGSLQGRTVEDSARISIAARVWPEIQITSVSHRIKVDRVSMAPYPPDGIAFGRHQRGGLDSLNMQVRRVDRGPNTGYWYLGTPMRILASIIYVHPALYLPTSLPSGINSHSPGYSDWRDFYDDQNGIGSGTCRAADVVTFRRNVERHEGVTLANNSHVGIANYSFRRDSAQSKMERVFSPVDSTAVRQRVSVLWDSLTNRTSGYRQLQAHFDSTDTPNVFNIGCTLDMQRSDP